jgi:hypothetical protein
LGENHSLFNEDSKSGSKHRCDSCVCEFFHDLVDDLDFCSQNLNNFLVLVLKGIGPLSLSGTASPTLFQFVRFDDRKCCVVLSYEVTTETGTETRNLLVDCRDVIAVTCVRDGDLGAAALG